MKKLLVVLLAVLVLSGAAILAIACSEEETTTTEAMEETTVSEAVTTTEAEVTSGAITPAEAQALGDAVIAAYKEAGSPEDKTGFAEEDVTVAGPVFSVKDKGTFVIVVLGDDTGSCNILVPYEVFKPAGLTLDSISAWVGQSIEVTGDIVVNDWGSLAEIQVSDLTQLTLPQ